MDEGEEEELSSEVLGRREGGSRVSFTSGADSSGPRSSEGEDSRVRTRKDELQHSSTSSASANLAESGVSSSSSGFTEPPTAGGGDAQRTRQDLRWEAQQQKQYAKTFAKLTENNARRAGGLTASSYEELLGQFGELSGELARSIATSQRLLDENDELLGHYDKLKVEHLRLRTKYVEARKQALEEADARVNLEQHHDDQLRRWRRQLEVKAREFEDLQLQISPPEDSKVLQHRLRAELEASHRSQLLAREAEIDKLRAAYFSEHNAHELLRTEFEQFTENQRREAEAVSGARASEAAEHRAQLQLALKESEENSRSDQVRLRQLDVEKVSAERDAVRTQLAESRREIDELKLKIDTAAVAHAAALASRAAEAREQRALLAGLEKRLEATLSEARRYEDAVEASNSRGAALSSELSKLRSRMEAAQQSAEEERQRVAKYQLEAAAKWERERHDLRASIESLERKLTLAEQRHSEERKLDAARSAGEVAEAHRARERAEEQFREVARAKEALDQERSELRSKLEIGGREASEAADRARGHQEQLTGQLRRVTKEKEALHEKAQLLTEQLRDVRSKADEAQARAAELEKEYSALREKHRETIAREQSVHVRLERSETQNSLQDKELREKEDTIGALKSAAEALRSRIDALQAESSGKENGFKHKLAEQIFQQTKLGQHQVDKLERKREVYHEALEKTKRRVRELTAKLYTAQRQMQANSQSHRVEVDVLQRRLKELERDREINLSSQETKRFSLDELIDI